MENKKRFISLGPDTCATGSGYMGTQKIHKPAEDLTEYAEIGNKEIITHFDIMRLKAPEKIADLVNKILCDKLLYQKINWKKRILP